MKPTLLANVLDASKMMAAAFLGWTITATDIDMLMKIGIGGATLCYMVGKACLVWMQVGRVSHGKSKLAEQDVDED